MKKKYTDYPSIDLNHTKDASFFEKKPIIPGFDMISILKILNRKNKNLPAIDSNQLKATYQELIDDSHKLSLAFRELGVKKKDIVTLSLPSNYQAIISFFALNEIGAVTTFIDNYATDAEVLEYLSCYTSPILVNFDKSKEENQYIKDNSNVKYIVTLSSKLSNEKDIDLKYIKNESDYLIDFHTMGSLSKFKKKHLIIPNKKNNDALILYTSGSTGKPKAVVLTNKNILAAQMYAGNTSHTENITGTKTMTCVPLRYPYGMVTSLLTSLLWGKEAIMTPDWDYNTVKYYYDKKPNIVFGSPAVLDITMRNLGYGNDLSHISHFISGGDFLTEEKARIGYDFFKKNNNYDVEIGNGCGNAETVSIASTPVGVPLKQHTAGKILVGITPLIIDKDIDDDKVIIDGNSLEEKKHFEVGELCISGDLVFKEYFNDKEKTACAKFKRGKKTFFRTGTLGYIDDDGYFVPTDRKSRFFIRSTGHKVYLDNVQRIIMASSNLINDIACVKIPDEDLLYQTKAYIVLKDGVMPDEDTKRLINDSLLIPINTNGKNEQLKEYEIPSEIEFISELPRVKSTGKINYKELEALALKNKNVKTLKL